MAAYKEAVEERKLGEAIGIGNRQNAEILAAQELICSVRDQLRASEITSPSKSG